jgi:TetR/AcrR family tetracycline transcriptional repressor
VPPPGADWQAWALDNARSFRRALLAYRDGARIHAGTAPGADMVPRIDAQLRLLCGAGFAPADALRAMVAIGRYTVGWVLEEQAELESGATEVPGPTAADVKSYPLVAQGLKGWRKSKPDANFDFGVRLMIAGLAAQLATQPPATPAPGRRKDSAPRQTAA